MKFKAAAVSNQVRTFLLCVILIQDMGKLAFFVVVASVGASFFVIECILLDLEIFEEISLNITSYAEFYINQLRIVDESVSYETSMIM